MQLLVFRQHSTLNSVLLFSLLCYYQHIKISELLWNFCQMENAICNCFFSCCFDRKMNIYIYELFPLSVFLQLYLSRQWVCFWVSYAVLLSSTSYFAMTGETQSPRLTRAKASTLSSSSRLPCVT